MAVAQVPLSVEAPRVINTVEVCNWRNLVILHRPRKWMCGNTSVGPVAVTVVVGFGEKQEHALETRDAGYWLT